MLHVSPNLSLSRSVYHKKFHINTFIALALSTRIVRENNPYHYKKFFMIINDVMP